MQVNPLNDSHDYFKPDTSDGIYERCPCPAINTLANHGYINRDGKDIEDSKLVDAIHVVFGLHPYYSKKLISKTKKNCSVDEKSNFSLNQISKHNLVEHDVSLFHHDFNINPNHSLVSNESVEELIILSSDGVHITWNDLVQHKKNRLEKCKTENKDLVYDFKQKVISFFELYALMNLFSSHNKITIEHLKSFIVDEKIPENFRKNENAISICNIISSLNGFV
uniref:Heme haloperoxidase family profile domain-containing protein n=1 Tax=viral metagenome TaxID=1070528 RepID=A0A6C0BCK8_9ZZZZ